MKKFLVTQSFGAPSAEVTSAFRDENTWRSFGGLPFVGDPSLIGFEHGESAKVTMAYRVDIELPPLADKFIEADKMTFVEHTELHKDGSGAFKIVPDHYKKLLKASGIITMVAVDDNHCERRIQGSVDVRLGWAGKLFEGPVEDAIVNGLSEALIAQSALVQLG